MLFGVGVLFIYLLKTERLQAGRGQSRGREFFKPTAGSAEPDVGPLPQSTRSQPEPKPRAGRVADLAIQMPLTGML